MVDLEKCCEGGTGNSEVKMTVKIFKSMILQALEHWSLWWDSDTWLDQLSVDNVNFITHTMHHVTWKRKEDDIENGEFVKSP